VNVSSLSVLDYLEKKEGEPHTRSTHRRESSITSLTMERKGKGKILIFLQAEENQKGRRRMMDRS